MDRIIEISVDGERIRQGAMSSVSWISRRTSGFFDCHFPGDPVMPGCLGLDAMWQIHRLLALAGRAHRAKAAAVAFGRRSSSEET